MKKYSSKFYKSALEGVMNSAHIIIPILLRIYKPKSVLDIGCGIGAWLSAFRQYGIEDGLGVDGPWVDTNMLLIPKERFIIWDLSKPFKMEREFDLVVSLEVAEHLEESCAENFITTLTSHGPVVLFSAAIPFQEGEHHVNEQWPEYWIKLFEKKDFVVVDYIRPKIWQNDKVDYWYAQNILIFCQKEYLERQPLLKKAYKSTIKEQLSIVHPRLWIQVHANMNSPGRMTRRLQTAFIKALKRKVKN